MIPDQDRDTITRLAEHYRIKRLFLFGSSADPSHEGRDIDLAVEGLPAQDFFRFYGDLIFSVSKPIDLVDLSQDSKFTRLIRREGVPLYDAAQSTG
jgi:predicted nucleotidyltransferase